MPDGLSWDALNPSNRPEAVHDAFRRMARDTTYLHKRNIPLLVTTPTQPDQQLAHTRTISLHRAFLSDVKLVQHQIMEDPRSNSMDIPLPR